MGERYRYGWEKTIHGSTWLDIEQDPETGEVVSVWFRCMVLPFKAHRVDPQRAAEMRRTYEGVKAELYGVDVEVDRTAEPAD